MEGWCTKDLKRVGRKESYCIKESCTAEGPPMVAVIKIQDPHPCSFMVTHKKGGGGCQVA
jgi:hypothetical protein